jgi:hypothetical protein
MKNWRTTLVGAILAVIIAVQPIITTGAVDWKAVGLAALVALLGYLAKDAGVTGTVKTIALLIGLSLVCNPSQAQSKPFKGFFKPVTTIEQQTKFNGVISIDDGTPKTAWLFRPTITINALKMQYVGGEKTFENSSLQTLGTGIAYQKYIDLDGTPYCQFAVNALVLYNLDYQSQTPINLGAAITLGVFNNIASAGVGWDAKQKYPFILLNISYPIFK